MGNNVSTQNSCIELIQCLEDERLIMAWRYPMQNQEILYGARLSVRDSQTALFFNDEVIADVFTPGKYSLTAHTMPVMSSLRQWTKKIEVSFPAHVCFFSTRERPRRSWETATAILIHLPQVGAARVRTSGTYSFHLVQPVLFYKKISDFKGKYTTEELESQLRVAIVGEVATLFAEDKEPFHKLANDQELFAQHLRQRVSAMFERYGLGLDDFTVDEVAVAVDPEKQLSFALPEAFDDLDLDNLEDLYPATEPMHRKMDKPFPRIKLELLDDDAAESAKAGKTTPPSAEPVMIKKPITSPKPTGITIAPKPVVAEKPVEKPLTWPSITLPPVTLSTVTASPLPEVPSKTLPPAPGVVAKPAGKPVSPPMPTVQPFTVALPPLPLPEVAVKSEVKPVVQPVVQPTVAPTPVVKPEVVKPAVVTKPVVETKPVAAVKPVVETKPVAAMKPVVETKPAVAARPVVPAVPAAPAMAAAPALTQYAVQPVAAEAKNGQGKEDEQDEKLADRPFDFDKYLHLKSSVLDEQKFSLENSSLSDKSILPDRPRAAPLGSPFGFRPPLAATAEEVTQALERLYSLVGKGILTQGEFDAKKTELLKKLY